MSEREVWIGFGGGYDEGWFGGAFVDEEAALAWLRGEHEGAVKRGEAMEEHIRGRERRVRESGWWLPTDIEPRERGRGWRFDRTQGGAGHGMVEVYPVALKSTPPDSDGDKS